MAVLVDTDLLIDLERGAQDSPVTRLAEDIAISVVTMSELLQGVYRAEGAQRARRRAFVEGLFQVMGTIPITEPVARVRAELWADLSARGLRLGSNDLWIAATAVAHDFGIATRNVAEFQRVPGLRLVAAA